MDWTEQLFNYCERGRDATLTAEPFNAASNAAFILVVVAATLKLRRHASATQMEAGQFWLLSGLLALAAVVGLGSFLFHTHATRWALLADVIPITAFMLIYLVFALRVFLNLEWRPIALIAITFLLAELLASSLHCSPSIAIGIATVPTKALAPCFNGSLGYVPALAMLIVVAIAARARGIDTRRLQWAAAIFALALALRTLDLSFCSNTLLFGRPRGTHALWHVLIALVVYMLFMAALERHAPYGRGPRHPPT